MKIRPRGFTLIELLVVIAIIGLLSSVVLASLNTARVKARDAQRASDMVQVVNALELYANDHQASYPAAVTGSGCAGARSTYCLANTPGLAPTYIPSLPHDPTYANTVNDYLYQASTDRSQYILLRRDEHDNRWCVPPSSSLYDGNGWATSYARC
jgi:prepilin-type N-terminal cleavage/methylation domain-containing protein